MRRLAAKISFRLLAFNVLLVFLPVAGVSYLEIYERKLLEAQEQSMVQQGRVLAAALSERGVIDAALVEPVLIGLRQQTTSRIRVLDADSRLVGDTSRLGPRREERSDSGSDAPGSSLRRSPLYRLGSSLFRAVDALVSGPRRRAGSEDDVPEIALDAPEVRQALAGKYGAATRITPGGQRSVTLYSALPILDAGYVVGVVHVSQSTFQILQDLYEVRLAIFRFLLVAVLVAGILSLLVSTTISRPIKQLREQALALLDRRGRLTGRFRGTTRRDEIGDLSRALAALSARLEERMAFIESFAADVSHEFKNPLASMRSAAEMLADSGEPADRARFTAVIQADIARLEKLLSEVREITHLDVATETEDSDSGVVDVNALVRGVASRERYRDADLGLELDPEVSRAAVRVGPDRLVRVVENLLDNALGFTNEGTVRLRTRLVPEAVTLVVEDDGPGVGAEDREKIFDRFFTDRPNGDAQHHSGLGLAIVKTILERSGGSIRVSTSDLGGAAFEARLARRSDRERRPAP